MLHQDFWLTPEGVVEMSAAEHAKEGKRALMGWDEFYPIPDPFKKLTAAEAKDALKRGIDPAIVAYLKNGGDSRKWMMQHGGWVRTARNIIQFWELNDDTLKLIRNWLKAMKVEEWETFEMEELSTGTLITAQAKQLKRLGITKEALIAYGTGVGRFRNPPKRDNRWDHIPLEQQAAVEYFMTVPRGIDVEGRYGTPEEVENAGYNYADVLSSAYQVPFDEILTWLDTRDTPLYEYAQHVFRQAMDRETKTKKERKKKMNPEISAEVEGVWASPSGEIFPVVEHLLAISEQPELFDLPQSLRGERDVSVLRDAAELLIKNGWTRYRYLSGVYAFEVDTFVRRRKIIEEILQGVGAFEGEQVTISQMKPREEFEGTVEDVYAHRVGRFAANPGNNRWRFT